MAKEVCMDIQGAWITPTGDLIKTGMEWGHHKYAKSINKTELQLEEIGWAKIHVYHEAVVCMRGFNQKQIDTLFDFTIEHGYDSSEIGSLIDEHRLIMYFTKSCPSMDKSQN